MHKFILKNLSFFVLLFTLYPLNCSIYNTTEYYYKVTLRSDSLGTVCNAGDHLCQYNDTLQLAVCSTRTGYRFKEWIVDSVNGFPSCTIVDPLNDTAKVMQIRGNVNIRAEYIALSFTIKKIPPDVICVKQGALQNGGGEPGSSWVDAFNNLTDALAAVDESKNILWVAKGTYNTTSKNAPYVLPNGVTLIGGFIGTETSPNTRDSLRNTTVISGVVNSTDTANTILSISATSNNVTISNVTIANSKGLSENPSHGGLVAAATAQNLTVKCCLFKNNFPRALEPAKNSIIQQCVFVENKGKYGAALTVNSGSGTVVRNCVFYKNETSGTGAAAYVGATDCALVNCTIVFNRSTGVESSGGISNGGGLSLINCIIWDNTVSSTAYGTQVDITDLVAECNIQNYATTGVAEKNPGWMTSNIDIDPLFINSTAPVINDYDYFTLSSGLRLQAGSTCIDNGARISGHDDWWPSVDIKGSVSPNGDYDMGAYEE